MTAKTKPWRGTWDPPELLVHPNLSRKNCTVIPDGCIQPLSPSVRRVIKELRETVRDCARTLQHNISMACIKDEQMMLKSLERAWETVGRSYCERSPQRAERRRKK